MYFIKLTVKAKQGHGSEEKLFTLIVDSNYRRFINGVRVNNAERRRWADGERRTEPRGRHAGRGRAARRGTRDTSNREGAPAGNRGVPGLLEYSEVAARGAPARASRPPRTAHALAPQPSSPHHHSPRVLCLP